MEPPLATVKLPPAASRVKLGFKVSCAVTGTADIASGPTLMVTTTVASCSGGWSGGKSTLIAPPSRRNGATVAGMSVMLLITGTTGATEPVTAAVIGIGAIWAGIRTTAEVPGTAVVTAAAVWSTLPRNGSVLTTCT